MTLELGICRTLRSILDELTDGAAIDHSDEFREVLSGLERFLPDVLSEVYPFWKYAGLDGLMPSLARKTGRGEAEIAGLCILIEDQAVTPIHVRLQVSDEGDEITWLECKLGESGPGEGGMRRTPYGASRVGKQFFAAEQRADSIDWVYKVTFGQRTQFDNEHGTA